MASATKSIIAAILAVVGVALPGGAGAQDAEGSIELVDPHVFRACADPRDLPLSNEAGEGFENKIAELFARKLGKSVGYTFYPDATGFHPQHIERLSLRRRLGDRSRRRPGSANEPLLSNGLRRRVSSGWSS